MIFRYFSDKLNLFSSKILANWNIKVDNLSLITNFKEIKTSKFPMKKKSEKFTQKSPQGTILIDWCINFSLTANFID